MARVSLRYEFNERGRINRGGKRTGKIVQTRNENGPRPFGRALSSLEATIVQRQLQLGEKSHPFHPFEEEGTNFLPPPNPLRFLLRAKKWKRV